VRVVVVGCSFGTVVLLPEAAARDAAVEAIKCEETPLAALEAVFVGGFVEGCGGRVLDFVVELEGAAAAAEDAELPSGAVESIVVC